MAIPASDFWSSYMAQEAAAAACSYIATRGGAALGSLAGGFIGSGLGPGGVIIGSGIGSYIGGAGGAALGAALCDNQPPSAGQYPLSPAAPFQGGQCVGTVYLVEVVYIRNGQQLTYRNGLQGPIGRAFIREEPVGDGTTTAWIGRIPSRYGETTFDSIGSQFPKTIIVSQGFYGPPQGPDNCGNLDAPVVVPRPGVDFPLPENDPSARRPLSVDVDFGNNNIVNIGGTLQLTGLSIGVNGPLVGFNFNGVQFGFNPQTGDINIGRGNPPPGGTTPPPNPEDDPNQQLAGLFYTSIATTSAARYVLLNGGRYYFPRVGSFRFIGNGEQSEEIQINAEKGFVKNPLPDVFRGYTFTKQAGIDSVTTRPLWKRVEDEAQA